jgi:hypothetical protein
MEFSINMILEVGIGLGVLASGYGLGKSKVPFLIRKKVDEMPFDKLKKLETLEISEETGGMKHISQEGLSKYRELVKKIEGECMSNKAHDLICAREKSEMKLYISETMGEHTDKILKEIRNVRTNQAGGFGTR